MRVSFAQIVFDTLLLTGITLSAQLTINIPPSQQLPNPSVLPASTHATLQSVGPPISTQLTRTSKFSFDDVPSGSYLLNVHCRDYFFEPLRIDVVKNETAPSREYVTAWQTFRGNEWDNKGEVRGQGDGSGEVKVDVRCIGGKDYYQQRQGFSILSFLKSPMILMALFSLGLIVGMPYLMENMDPESRAEFEEMQKSSPLANMNPANPTAALGNFDFASWMAGRTAEQSSSSQAQKNTGSGQGSGRRRG